LDAYSGDLIWSYKTDGPVQSSPAISDGLLFVGSDDGNLYAIGYPTTQSFDVKIGENASYEVKIQSSLAVSDFTFNGPLKQFSFQVNNETGKSGFCNVSFPYSLLKGAYTVLANENQSLRFEEYENGSQVFLYFNISSDVDIIRILGTEAISEFSPGTSAIAILVITAMIVAVYKSTPKKTKTKGSE